MSKEDQKQFLERFQNYSKEQTAGLLIRNSLRALPLVSWAYGGEEWSAFALQTFRAAISVRCYSAGFSEKLVRATLQAGVQLNDKNNSVDEFSHVCDAYSMVESLENDWRPTNPYQGEVLNYLGDRASGAPYVTVQSICDAALFATKDDSRAYFSRLYSEHALQDLAGVKGAELPNCFEEDIAFLGDRDSPKLYLSRSLWNGHPIPRSAEDLWSTLKADLLSRPDERWDFWIDWYDSLLRGRLPGLSTERRVALIPNENWQSGPLHLNSLIDQEGQSASDDSSSNLPNEHLTALRFDEKNEKIGLLSSFPSNKSSEKSSRFHAALLEDAAALAAICPKDSNRYGMIGVSVEEFQLALGPCYEATETTRLWLAARRLRGFARADADKRSSNVSDEERLEADHSSILAQLVSTFNVFTKLDPTLAAMDASALDSEYLSTEFGPEIDDFRSAVSQSTELFEKETEAAISGLIDESRSSNPHVSGRGRVLLLRSMENLLIAVVRRALSEKDLIQRTQRSEFRKGFEGTLGKTLAGSAAIASGALATAFIANYQSVLIAFVSQLPASSIWISIIKKIASLWS